MPDKLFVIQLILSLGDKKAKKNFHRGKYSLGDNETMNLATACSCIHMILCSLLGCCEGEMNEVHKAV